MRFRLSLLPVLALPACFDDCDDKLHMLNMTAVEVLLLHTPDLATEYGLEAADVGQTVASVYLADLGAEAEDVLLSGATVKLRCPGGQVVDLPEVEEGRYEATSLDATHLEYRPDADYTVLVTMDGEAFSATATAQAETTISRPGPFEVVPAGQDLTVVVGQETTSTLVGFYDREGTQIYNTFPTSETALSDLVMAAGGRETSIPGRFLAEDEIYFLGAAAVDRGEYTSLTDNLNPELSFFVSGTLDAVAIGTSPWEALGGLVFAMDGSGLESQGIFLEPKIQASLYASRMTVRDGVENLPLSDGVARLGWGAQEVTLAEADDEAGLYECDTIACPSLAYQAGATYTFTFASGGDTYTLQMAAPAAPALSSPAAGSYHAPGTALTLATPASHDRFFAVVMDATGEVAWTDFPEEVDVQQVIDGTLGTGPGSSIQIPGNVFTSAGRLYAVGLLGLDEAAPGGVSDNLNGGLSGMYVGTTTFTSVVTFQM